MNRNVPSHWKMMKFRDVAEVVTGSTPSTIRNDFFGGDIPFVTPTELKGGIPVTKTPVTLTELGAKQVRVIPENSIMVCCIGSLGKIGIAGTRLATNQQINSLVFDEKIVSPRYGYHYCQTLKPLLAHLAPSTTVPIINKGRFQELQIPLPPLPEQKRIAAILDKADSIRRKRQEAVRLTEELLRSAFLEMFGDPVANTKGWEGVTIRDLVTEVKYGTSDKASYEGKYPVLRMNNITYLGGWNFTDLKRIDIPEKELSKYLVRKGDILFNRTNSKELVGKTAVYRRDEPMAYAGYLIRIRPNKHNNSEYIAAYLNSTHGKTILESMCKSIVGMANINAQELQEIAIMQPPLELQNQYASLAHSVEKAKEKLISSSKVTDTLFNALLQRAFLGEL